MEETIQSNQIDVEKEEGRPNPEVASLPQERHIWRMPELSPIRQGINQFQVAEIELYQCQYKNWYREAKEEELEICPRLWQGAMHSYTHLKSFLGQEKTIELLGGWSPFSFKEKVKKIKNWLKNQSLLSIDQKKELEMAPTLEKEGPVVSTSSKPAPEVSEEKPKRPQKKQKGPNNHQGKGKGKANWHRPYPQEYRIPKLEPSAVESVFNMDRNFMEFTANIDLELDKIDAKLTKITWDTNDLKNNDRHSSEWDKSTISKLDSITNTCDRIKSECQVEDDEIGDVSISHINEQLTILRNQVLEMIKNTNQFATHLEKSDSERQKLKNEIIKNVEQIHKNIEPHMPRHSTPLTEEKRSVKGSLTPFLG
ncbi:hypothetical protein O181_101230 [Austropuccinia psidii MF-1]|uniref:Uncharacterized protein n=1 Tax=Austropuccinia psidii MF-1 TaxID=1389203 RepID=A0A9Q3PHJ8_9BASI|nr:hypothetical protein [Austropuccinia psidii MF-1]